MEPLPVAFGIECDTYHCMFPLDSRAKAAAHQSVMCLPEKRRLCNTHTTMWMLLLHCSLAGAPPLLRVLHVCGPGWPSGVCTTWARTGVALQGEAEKGYQERLQHRLLAVAVAVRAVAKRLEGNGAPIEAVEAEMGGIGFVPSAPPPPPLVFQRSPKSSKSTVRLGGGGGVETRLKNR